VLLGKKEKLGALNALKKFKVMVEEEGGRRISIL
jgi:hypothetical protein